LHFSIKRLSREKYNSKRADENAEIRNNPQARNDYRKLAISAKKIVTRGREIRSDGQVVAPKVSVTRNAH